MSHLVFPPRCSEVDKFLLAYVILKLRLIKGKCIIFVNDVDRSYRLKLFLEQFSIKSCVLNSELPLNSRHVLYWYPFFAPQANRIQKFIDTMSSRNSIKESMTTLSPRTKVGHMPSTTRKRKRRTKKSVSTESARPEAGLTIYSYFYSTRRRACRNAFRASAKFLQDVLQ